MPFFTPFHACFGLTLPRLSSYFSTPPVRMYSRTRGHKRHATIRDDHFHLPDGALPPTMPTDEGSMFDQRQHRQLVSGPLSKCTNPITVWRGLGCVRVSPRDQR
jgi:hypothetical protein